jgi:hypothetical protein
MPAMVASTTSNGLSLPGCAWVGPLSPTVNADNTAARTKCLIRFIRHLRPLSKRRARVSALVISTVEQR